MKGFFFLNNRISLFCTVINYIKKKLFASYFGRQLIKWLFNTRTFAYLFFFLKTSTERKTNHEIFKAQLKIIENVW